MEIFDLDGHNLGTVRAQFGQLSLENAKFRHQKKQSKRSASINFPIETRRNLIRNYPDHFIEAFPSDNHKSLALIKRCQERNAENGLFGESYVLEYLNDQRRHCCRPETIRNSYTNILLFIKYLKQTGHSCITTTTRNDLSGFIEQEQDRGLMPGTIATTLRALYSFLAYLVDQGIVSFDLLRKKFREVMGKHFFVRWCQDPTDDRVICQITGPGSGPKFYLMPGPTLGCLILKLGAVSLLLGIFQITEHA